LKPWSWPVSMRPMPSNSSIREKWKMGRRWLLAGGLMGFAAILHAQAPAITPAPARPAPTLPTTLKPMMDYPMRDTSVCAAPDGMYYLTGTTGSPDWWAVTGDIQVWTSPDLKDWSAVVTHPRPRTVVWNVDRDGTWQKPVGLRNGAPFRPVWAPEIQYLKDTFWLTYAIPGLGGGILKSVSGTAEGPYVSPLKPDQSLVANIDLMLFEDTDGKVYLAYGGGYVAEMKDDMTGLAEAPWQIQPTNAPRVGAEGAYLFKANGRYYMAAAEFENGDYNCYIASADNVRGPYGDRYLAIPHGGHNSFFKDKDGDWWCTFFGNDPHAPFRERPAVMRIMFSSDGRISPRVPKVRP
jgi:xylan 1,4-beta-xylosidase